MGVWVCFLCYFRPFYYSLFGGILQKCFDDRLLVKALTQAPLIHTQKTLMDEVSGCGPYVSGCGPYVSGCGPYVSGCGPYVSGCGPEVSGCGPYVSGCGP